jgi:hypothetical protein
MFHNRIWPITTSALQRARQSRTDPLVPATGGGGDVSISPNPSWSGLALPGDTNWQQITGIDTQVTLSTLFTGLSGYDMVTVYRNSSATKTGATTSSLSPTSLSTFTVQPNQYVLFNVSFTVTLGQCTVKNVSDSNVTINTFNYDNT